MEVCHLLPEYQILLVLWCSVGKRKSLKSTVFISLWPQLKLWMEFTKVVWSIKCGKIHVFLSKEKGKLHGFKIVFSQCVPNASYFHPGQWLIRGSFKK